MGKQQIEIGNMSPLAQEIALAVKIANAPLMAEIAELRKSVQGESNKTLLTVKEAAAKLNLCEKTILRKIKSGEIEAEIWGNRYRIRVESLEKQ